MISCVVERCNDPVSKNGHTLCYEHWQAQEDGELAECEICGRLKEDERPLCFSCFKSRKVGSPIVSTHREPGQGAREKADALARKTPFGHVAADTYSWDAGAQSEERVGRELSKLPGGWFVRHDIKIGPRGWNADHVVVGPPGAFVLDTKFRSGEVRTTSAGILVDGRRTKMSEKVQDQAREISSCLGEASRSKCWVQPVLVFDNDVRGKREPDGVHVVGLAQVVHYLTDMLRELDDEAVRQLGRALLDDNTWPHVSE